MQERGASYQHENSCAKNVLLASLENQSCKIPSYFNSLFSFLLDSVGGLPSVSDDIYIYIYIYNFIASLFL